MKWDVSPPPTEQARRVPAARAPTDLRWTLRGRQDRGAMTKPALRLQRVTEVSQLSSVRRAIAQWLADAVPTATIETAQLVITELLTNALEHGGGAADPSVEIRAGSVHIAVGDGVSGAPRSGVSAATSTNGKGLLIVDRVSMRWGIEPTANGKIVWSEVSTAAH
jgi:hypothetical protein